MGDLRASPLTPSASGERFSSAGAAWAGVAITVAAHLLFVAVLPDRWRANQSTDYFEYNEPAARHLLGGKGLVDKDGQAAILKPPGQSLILAALFHASSATGIPEDLVLRVYIVAMISMAALALYALASQMLPPRGALLAVALWAAFPFHLWIAKQPNTEVPFLALFFTAVWLAVREVNSRRLGATEAVVIGMTIGVASLIRPIGIALSGVFILWTWSGARPCNWRRRFVYCTLIACGNLIAVSPWEVWAHNRTGRLIPLSNHTIDSVLDGLTFGIKGTGTALLVSDDLHPLMHDTLERQRKGEFPTTVSIFEYITDRFIQTPDLVLRLLLIKMCRAWFGTNEQWLEGWIIVIQIPYLMLAVWGGIVAFRSDSKRRNFVYFVLLMTAYFWVMTVLALSILRYMLPVLGLFMILIAFTLFRGRAFTETGLQAAAST